MLVDRDGCIDTVGGLSQRWASVGSRDLCHDSNNAVKGESLAHNCSVAVCWKMSVSVEATLDDAW